jgi:hypothetical protein
LWAPIDYGEHRITHLLQFMLLAAPAEPVDFKGMEKRPETLQKDRTQPQAAAADRAKGENLDMTTLHTGEMVFIPIHRRIDGLAAGELAAAD